MSVNVFVGINVFNIYNNNEMMISLIILIGLMNSSNNCNSIVMIIPYMVLSIILGVPGRVAIVTLDRKNP